MPRRPPGRPGPEDPRSGAPALLRELLDLAARPPRRWDDPRVLSLAVLALLALAAWFARRSPEPHVAGPAPAPSAEGYLFCSWNVENLFDDVDDPDVRDVDEDWFGTNPALVRAKVDHLAEALLMQADGRGPDILAVVEVENRHAAELLQDSLNHRLAPDLRYSYLIFRENRTGRHFAPAILSRLPGRIDPDFEFRPTLRILAGRIEAGGAPLTVLASHWTSRLTDQGGGRRAIYGDAHYRAARDLGPDADLLICGDFNDEPDDPSVRDHLHAIGDAAVVRDRRGPLRLLDLMAGPHPGTIEFRGRFQTFDHLVAAPGLLDPPGWVVLPETLRVADGPSLRIGRNGRPWRFGGPREAGPRGYSDHFAVTVRLRVPGG